MFFIFPEDARWNAERQAVEFGECSGLIRVPRRVFWTNRCDLPTA